MPDVHLYQWLAAFVVAVWWTNRWLLTRPTSRWRHILGGIPATLLWIPVAYTADSVYVNDSGVTAVFGSDALATFATFMVVVNLVGLLIGLMLWAEETVDDASDDLPPEAQRPRGGD